MTIRENLKQSLRPAIVLMGIMLFTTGLVYPAMVTGIASIFFPERAEGSLIEENGKIVGSELIGQPFTSPAYFWSRPSATSDFPYNAIASTGSNLGPSNPQLMDNVQLRAETLRQADPNHAELVPVDLVTASASGLDPHVSVASAIYQIPRVALAREVSAEAIRKLVDEIIERRQFGIFGESRVNILKLNLLLDKTYPLD